MNDVEAVHRLLAEREATVAVAESLTGGMLGAELTTTPGASATFSGGVIAYATRLKHVLLGVPRTLLDEHGAVNPEVAAAMAQGVRERLGTTYGLAVTGVAGPDPQDGQPPGTVFTAVAGPGHTVIDEVRFQDVPFQSGPRPVLPGETRDQIRRATVVHAVALLRSVLEKTDRE